MNEKTSRDESVCFSLLLPYPRNISMTLSLGPSSLSLFSTSVLVSAGGTRGEGQEGKGDRGSSRSERFCVSSRHTQTLCQWCLETRSTCYR